MRGFFAFVFFAIFLQTTALGLQLDSPSVILVEQTTGRVLYARGERERRYPANLTKMLTALVAAEALEPYAVVEIGPEIRGMPAGWGANVHFEGETASVRLLLSSMFIRGANEPARVLALNTVRRLDGRRNVTMEQANPVFAALLNEKARELGARGTNFNNAFGHHNDSHFSTAYDLALITRAVMDNPVLAEIAGLQTFEGDSLDGAPHHAPNVREFSWTSTNLMLPGGTFGYPYMTGAMAGFSNAAGHVLAGAAEHRGLQLVTVVLGGTDAARWQDTRRLMDYGFANFAFRTAANPGDPLQEVYIENPRLGDDETLELILGECPSGFVALLSHDEYAAIETHISLDPLLQAEAEYPTLRAPIEYGARVGTATIAAGDDVLFEVPVLAGREVLERNFDSDMDYHLAAFFGRVFSRTAVPYYFAVMGVAFGIFGIIYGWRANRRAARSIGWTFRRR